MVLTVSFALFPVIGLSCHRRPAETSARLDAGVEASEPHDFAVCSSVLVQRDRKIAPDAIRIHRIPLPTSVTIAKRPFNGAGQPDI
jgi:hypothetical protein